MLSVERAVSTYVVPREARADALRRRADRVLRERVPSALPGLVAGSFAEDGVWLLERIDVDFAFAAGAFDDDELARAWSEQILLGLANAVRKNEGLLRFPSRAAFIAQYVSDVAGGRAGGRWYYAQFASLAALPPPSVIREIVIREPSIAFDVLAELARMRRLRTVVELLSERGLAEVWEAAFPRPMPEVEPSAALVQSLLAAWTRVPARTPLHLAAAVLEEQLVAEPERLRAHVEALLGFARMMDEAADSWPLVEAVIDGDAAAAIARAAARGGIPDLAALRFFTRLAAAGAAVVTCVAGTIRSSVVGASERCVEGEVVPTRFAALALLLPVIADLDMLTSDALRVLAAARCAGTRALLDDPIARLFAGDEVDVEAGPHEDLIATLASIAVLESFAARLPGFAASSAAHLRKNFLEGRGAIRFDGGRIEVELPPLPLALVLRIAGMHAQTFEVPWLPGRTIAFRLPEGS